MGRRCRVTRYDKFVCDESLGKGTENDDCQI